MERARLESILSRLDGCDAAGVAASFAEDGELRLTGRDPAHGRTAVGLVLQDELAPVEGLVQRVTGLWEIPDGFVREATVTYRLRGGGQVTVPEVAIVHTRGDQIRELRVHRDPAPLQRARARPLEVRHEERGVRGAFYVVQDGRRVGELWYTVAGPTLLVIDRAEVGPELRGRDAGTRLVEAAVAWARQSGKRVLPLSPFARGVLERSHELQDVVAQE